MSIFVREFEEGDRAALRDLYVASRDAAFTWDPVGSHQASDFDQHTEGERILVAIKGARVMGFASVWEPDSFVHNLFVHPSALRQGVGEALLAACTPYFSKAPTLKCLQANVNAQRFYQAQGWVALREDVGPEGPYVLMTKALTMSDTASI